MTSLEPILQYRMTEREAKVFKLCLMWIEESRRVFPDMAHATIPKKGDPRKCLLFKICWKLFRETESFIALKDYRLYIRAQLDVMKNIKRPEGEESVRIDPVILTGDRAFIRWKMWKRKYDQVDRAKQHGKSEDQPVQSADAILPELRNTRKWLLQSMPSGKTPESLHEIRKSGLLSRYFDNRRISPYYVLLSPWIRAEFSDTKIRDYFRSTDFDIYKRNCTAELLAKFKSLFPEEF